MNYQNKIKTSIVVTILFIIATTISCSNASPPINLAKSDFTNRNIKSQNFYNLLSLEKTDGIITNMLGMNVYIITWRSIIELKRDCYFYIYEGRPGAMESLMGFDISISNDGSDNKIYPLGWKKHQGKKGQRITLHGYTKFVKSERGWQLYEL